MPTHFPKYFSRPAIVVYIIALLTVNLAFLDYAMPFWLQLFGIVSVVAFFYYANAQSKQWQNISSKIYVYKLFWISLIIRFIYVIFIYFFNVEHYGCPYESNTGDVEWYVPTAEYLAKCISDGIISWDIIKGNLPELSDAGYIIYLTMLYTLTLNISSVVLPLIFKSVLGAITCVFIYRIARNHFEESVARMAGIFCMLQFNLIWWCGSMMKETEMIFLFCWFIYNVDSLLLTHKKNTISWITTCIIGLILFSFRTVLGVIAFMSLFFTLLLQDSKTINKSKKILIGVLMSVLLVLFTGNAIFESAKGLLDTATNTEYQQRNMEWRTGRGGTGNQFAKYAGAAVFAPLIFTIPFPSMVYTFQSQEMQMMVNGGNYVKNVLSFFVVFSMFFMLFTKEWKKHVLPIAMLCGYLVALVFSVFGQSGRFHMPAVPLEMMFAAYGVSLMNKKRRKWFSYALVVEFVACIAWNWFKLAGRGLA